MIQSDSVFWRALRMTVKKQISSASIDVQKSSMCRRMWNEIESGMIRWHCQGCSSSYWTSIQSSRRQLILSVMTLDTSSQTQWTASSIPHPSVLQTSTDIFLFKILRHNYQNLSCWDYETLDEGTLRSEDRPSATHLQLVTPTRVSRRSETVLLSSDADRDWH